MRPIHLAVFTLGGMYTATTVIGATLFTTEFGRDQLQAFMGSEPVPFGLMTTLGSPIYWALLLSLLMITPIVALATERAAPRFLAKRTALTPPTWVPILIAAFLVAWCIYKLTAAGALTANELWDRSVDFSQRMERRVELIGLLGNQYYGLVYSSLPILASFLLAKAVLQRDRFALGAFCILSATLFWLDVVILMKAPVVIYTGLIGLTLILCGWGWIRTLVLVVPIAIIVYYSLSLLQFSDGQLQRWGEPMPPAASMPPSEPMSDKLGTLPVTANRAIYLLRSATLRMASSFPYYIQTFTEPNERCGLELPEMSLLPRKACFAPTKIFHLMYPDISYITGHAPAPANVSAYAELGFTYAIVVDVICGVIIGVLCFLAKGRNALSICIGTAACIYAYYVSQVSLIGSLLDSYGLFWLLLPVAAMIVISSFSAWLGHRGSQG